MPGAQCTRSLVRAIVVEYAHEWSQRRTRCANDAMSVARYGLSMLAGHEVVSDPHRSERESIEASVTRQKLEKNRVR